MTRPQSGNDPGTTKLLDDNNGPPGQKCPRGRWGEKGRGSKIKEWIWKQLHCINAGGCAGAAAVRASPLGAKMCSDKAGGGGEAHLTGQEASARGQYVHRGKDYNRYRADPMETPSTPPQKPGEEKTSPSWT